jgi:antitoxin ParD1/3/4
MNVSVGKDFERYVQGKVASGDYASASEVVREGLRLLKERERLFEARLLAVKTEIETGIQQAEAGELLDGKSALDGIRRKLGSPDR